MSVTFDISKCYAILTSLLFGLQTSMSGQNGVEFYLKSNEHGPRHILALLLAKIANERLKILTALLFDLQNFTTNPLVCWIFPSPLIAKIANDSERLRMTSGWVRMRGRGKGRGVLFLGRFYSSKWLAFPVLGHKKDPNNNLVFKNIE